MSSGFEVFNEIGIINQLASTAFQRVLPKGLTLPQFAVLNHFVRLGGERSPAGLASAFQVTRQTMTNTLQRLEVAGLIASRPDPVDGRAKRLTITPAGVAVRDSSIAQLAPLIDQLARQFGEAKLVALLPGLRQLREALDRARD